MPKTNKIIPWMIALWPEVIYADYINVKPWFKMLKNNYLPNKVSVLKSIKFLINSMSSDYRFRVQDIGKYRIALQRKEIRSICCINSPIRMNWQITYRAQMGITPSVRVHGSLQYCYLEERPFFSQREISCKGPGPRPILSLTVKFMIVMRGLTKKNHPYTFLHLLICHLHNPFCHNNQILENDFHGHNQDRLRLGPRSSKLSLLKCLFSSPIVPRYSVWWLPCSRSAISTITQCRPSSVLLLFKLQKDLGKFSGVILSSDNDSVHLSL